MIQDEFFRVKEQYKHSFSGMKFPIIHPHRNHSIYYSDQLEVIAESDSLLIGLLTDKIAVVQEWAEGTVTQEYEVIFSGTADDNKQFLTEMFLNLMTGNISVV